MEVKEILKLKLSLRELKILILLQMEGTLKNKDIVSKLGMPESNVSTALKSLLQKEFIKKEERTYSVKEKILNQYGQNISMQYNQDNQNILNQNNSYILKQYDAGENQLQTITNSSSTNENLYILSLSLKNKEKNKEKDKDKKINNDINNNIINNNNNIKTKEDIKKEELKPKKLRLKKELRKMTLQERKDAYRLIKEFREIRGLKSWNETDQVREMNFAKKFIITRQKTVEELIGLIYEIKEKLPFEWDYFWTLGTLWGKESQWRAKLLALNEKKPLNFHQWLEAHKDIPDLDYRNLPANKQFERAKAIVMAWKRAEREIVPTKDELEKYHTAVNILRR